MGAFSRLFIGWMYSVLERCSVHVNSESCRLTVLKCIVNAESASERGMRKEYRNQVTYKEWYYYRFYS